MSIKTDIASLEILAEVYQNQDLKESFHRMVRTLYNQVSYFDWVGLYLYHGDDMVLEAASDINDTLDWESNAELRIPIHSLQEKELGKLVVRSKQPLCFDVTDLSTLNTLAAEISKRLQKH